MERGKPEERRRGAGIVSIVWSSASRAGKEKRRQKKPRSLNCRAQTHHGQSASCEFAAIRVPPNRSHCRAAAGPVSRLGLADHRLSFLDLCRRVLSGQTGILPSSRLLRWRTSRKWRRSGKAPTAWSIKQRTKSPARWSRLKKSAWTRERKTLFLLHLTPSFHTHRRIQAAGRGIESPLKGESAARASLCFWKEV